MSGIFSGMENTSVIVIPMSNLEIFAERKFATRALAQNRCDFESGFGSGSGIDVGASSGGCVGGACGVR